MAKIVKTQPFTRYGTYGCMDELVSDVASLPDREWERFTHRQKNIVGHRDTRTIPLLFDPVRLSRHIEHPLYNMFSHHISAIASIVGGSAKRANLVALLAKSEIAPHYDKGDFLNSTRRIHVPVETNEGCLFTVGNEIQHIPFGEVWEINNTGMEHSVVNKGDARRIHMIIDVR